MNSVLSAKLPAVLVLDDDLVYCKCSFLEDTSMYGTGACDIIAGHRQELGIGVPQIEGFGEFIPPVILVSGNKQLTDFSATVSVHGWASRFT